jgi:polygalacturonase
MGVRIKSRRGRGGTIEDVRFDNWMMEDVGQAINVTNYYLMEGEKKTAEEPVTNRTPVFRNIAISNMTINRARVAVNIDGLPEMPIEGLRISDVVASAKVGLKASNTLALELHNVQVNTDGGASFIIRNSKEMELDGITTRAPHAGTPVVRLDNCPRGIVRNSRAFQGTDTFLSTAPGEIKDIILEGNVLGAARRATEEKTADYWQIIEPATEDK